MKSAIIEDGVVTNIIVGEIDGSVICADEVGIGWKYDGASFTAPDLVPPSLEDSKASQIESLNTACANAIVAGYASDALGETHTYPNAMKDQINMLGSVTDSLLPNLSSDWVTPFWCQPEAGAWAYRPHSAAQIQQAGADGKAHVINCQTILAQLSAQVSAANTVGAVLKVTWPDPQ